MANKKNIKISDKSHIHCYKQDRFFKLYDIAKILIIFLACIYGVIFGLIKYDIYLKEKESLRKEAEKQKEEENKLKEYNKCLARKYTEDDNTELLNNKINELRSYIINNYYASIVYEDIATGFNFKYGEDDIYYGASLIKLVEAEYIFDKAIKGEININDTIKYTANYISEYSEGMSKRIIGEEISLKDLISYSLMYSDNSAHFMLINYIGYNNLREYGKSMGAKNILVGDDSYGNQSASDTNIYLHHAYEIINNGGEYGKLLKEYMTNTYYNSLYLTEESNNNVAHKYGWYENFYHDIGIVYEENPYYISILTNHGNDDYKTVVNNIHKKVNELHHTFYEEREKNVN